MAAVGYVSGDPRKVDIAGSTMTGALVLSGDPSTDLQAAPKRYVDAVAGVGPGGFSRVIVIPSDQTDPPNDTPAGTVIVQLIPPSSITGTAVLELVASGQVVGS